MTFRYVLISGTACACKSLASQAQKRLRQAYTSKTWESCKRMFCTLLTFCVYIQKDVVELCPEHVTMYMEFLHQNELALGSIRNYMCGITSVAKWLHLDVKIFSHHKVSLIFKALGRSVHKSPNFKAVFTVENVTEILRQCDKFPYAQVYETAYIFAYMGFLRISNCVPCSSKVFCVKKHLCRGDILVNPGNIIIILKWTKTLQCAQEGTYIILPKLNNSVVCPCKNFGLLKQLYPVGKNSPCFSSKFFILTEISLRKHLKMVLANIGLDPLVYSFHAFRRSGATLADSWRT